MPDHQLIFARMSASVNKTLQTIFLHCLLPVGNATSSFLLLDPHFLKPAVECKQLKYDDYLCLLPNHHKGAVDTLYP
jgi:hypothetical protein